MKSVARWLSRYLLLLLLLFFAAMGYAAITGQYGRLSEWPRRLVADVQALEAASTILADYERHTVALPRSLLSDTALRSTNAIDARIARIRQNLVTLKQDNVDTGGISSQLMRGGEAEVVRVHQNRLRIRQLEIEASFLENLRHPAEAAEEKLRWEKQARAEVVLRSTACRNLTREADSLESQWVWRRYDVQGFHLRNLVTTKRVESHKACDGARSLQQQLANVHAARAKIEAALHNVPGDARDYAEVTEDVAGSLKESWLFKIKLWLRAHHAGRHLRTALIGVALAMMLPFLIRILFYVALAPLAARRPPIELQPDAAPMRADHAHSSVSKDVVIPVGWELLAKQGYVHRAPIGGNPSTRWPLSWRNPVVSVIRGLFFLTRYRGYSSETSATLSAGSDLFAELILLRLEDGQACMLQPRLIVAVLQPENAPVQITGHWRLGFLHAWLTTQLRYLVFHGPAVLVLKGYRGLHIVNADHDVELQQDHVVGFSANLRYGVVRTGTFMPYFFKRESLLRDRVRSGPGVVVTEEAPSLAAGRSGGHGARHSLEDALDVILKFFGL